MSKQNGTVTIPPPTMSFCVLLRVQDSRGDFKCLLKSATLILYRPECVMVTGHIHNFPSPFHWFETVEGVYKAKFRLISTQLWSEEILWSNAFQCSTQKGPLSVNRMKSKTRLVHCVWHTDRYVLIIKFKKESTSFVDLLTASKQVPHFGIAAYQQVGFPQRDSRRQML